MAILKDKFLYYCEKINDNASRTPGPQMGVLDTLTGVCVLDTCTTQGLTLSFMMKPGVSTVSQFIQSDILIVSTTMLIVRLSGEA